MGLDTTHDCWHGPYSAFYRWRIWLAAQVGIPLPLMEGFASIAIVETEAYDTSKQAAVHELLMGWHRSGLPFISWQTISDPLAKLLHHSDCDGKIAWWDCKPIALRLLQVLREMQKDVEPDRAARADYDGNYAATKRFALGCMRAYRAREHVTFR